MPTLEVFPSALVSMTLRGIAALFVVAHACVTKANNLFLSILHGLHDKLFSATGVSHWAVSLKVAYLISRFICHREPHTQ